MKDNKSPLHISIDAKIRRKLERASWRTGLKMTTIVEQALCSKLYNMLLDALQRVQSEIIASVPTTWQDRYTTESALIQALANAIEIEMAGPQEDRESDRDYYIRTAKWIVGSR